MASEEDVLLFESPLVGCVEVLSCVMVRYAAVFVLCEMGYDHRPKHI